jgi:hypothetical protein
MHLSARSARAGARGANGRAPRAPRATAPPAARAARAAPPPLRRVPCALTPGGGGSSGGSGASDAAPLAQRAAAAAAAAATALLAVAPLAGAATPIGDDFELPYAKPEVTTESSPRGLKLAARLRDAGARLYGAFWCSHWCGGAAEC